MSELFEIHDEKAVIPGGLFGPEVGWIRDGWTVIGVDEAGRGPLAGPVVAAAVAFREDILIEGIGDSKLVTPEDRTRLDLVIRESALAFAVAEASHTRIDEINILQATREAMAEATAKVAKAVNKPSLGIFCDGRIPPLGIGRQVNLIKGDGRSFTIGAASILAKVHRDRIMVEMATKYPGYGFAQHKGYATRRHIDAIRKLGRCEIHRRSFRLRELDEK